MIKITHLSSTELKRKTASIINRVAFGDMIAVIDRHGESLVKIVPFKTDNDKFHVVNAAKKYFGVMPDFPEINKKRIFRRKIVRI